MFQGKKGTTKVTTGKETACARAVTTIFKKAMTKDYAHPGLAAGDHCEHCGIFYGLPSECLPPTCCLHFVFHVTGHILF